MNTLLFVVPSAPCRTPTPNNTCFSHDVWNSSHASIRVARIGVRNNSTTRQRTKRPIFSASMKPPPQHRENDQGSPFQETNAANESTACRTGVIHSLESICEHYEYLFYFVIPMVFVGHRLPALAQEAATAPPKTGVVSDSVPVTPATVDDALLSRILGTIALILLVYASVGVIILTIQQIVLKRNDVQHRAWVKARINGDPYPKDPWSPEVDTWFPPKSSAAYTGNKVGVNRQQRRIENKLKEKQKKDQLKKEKRASARSSSKKSDDNKEK